MDYDRYLRFIPAEYRVEREPTATWWSWRNREIHIARAVNPDASVRVIGLHGAGGHAGLLWPVAALAGREGVEVLLPDMPLYGATVEPNPQHVRYGDWIDLLCELVERERSVDPRPLILVGASMGGLMAYEVAARTQAVAAVVATCLLDPEDPQAVKAAARFKVGAGSAPALLRVLDPLFGRTLVPVRWLVDMQRMSNDPDVSRACATDPRGGGVRIPLGFLRSWLDFRHTPPETFRAAPVTLVHPASDSWTPPQLSLRFLDRIAAPTEPVLLENCGHFPIEEPGITQAAETLRSVVRHVATSTT